jgi:hypothetical protein
MEPIDLQLFLTIARDACIIPGVHHHCDEWCDYCAVTRRCLGFRCTEEFRRVRKRRPGEPTFETLDEAIAFTQQVAAAEGGTTLELDALLSAGSERTNLSPADPMATFAFEYAVLVSQTMAEDAVGSGSQHSATRVPTPQATIVWHHVRIYLRVVRALVAKQRAELGLRVTPDDAAGSGKLVLVSLERSRRAWESLRVTNNLNHVDRAIELLDAIDRRMDEVLPEARGFIRIGLDVPAAPA